MKRATVTITGPYELVNEIARAIRESYDVYYEVTTGQGDEPDQYKRDIRTVLSVMKPSEVEAA